MDELSPDAMRAVANAANLRRAFPALGERDVPGAFATLLRRMEEVRPAPVPRAEPQRQGG
jgi:hypothetical protein